METDRRTDGEPDPRCIPDAQAIRKQIYRLRNSFSEEEIDSLSRQMTLLAAGIWEFQQAKRVLAYVDYRREARTCYLIEKAWACGKEVAVPKCSENQMTFHKLSSFSQLKPGSFGIPEPWGTQEVCWEDAVMLMPGVAFDGENHRLGHGGGYYDRYLAGHPGIFRIALALEFQRVDRVPVKPTDIRPHIVVTEREIYRYKLF